MFWLALMPTVGAQEVSYDLDAPFVLVGAARREGSGLKLAPPNTAGGAAWVDEPFRVPGGGGWVATFEAVLTPIGGDTPDGGLVFALQGEGRDALGGEMGYADVAPSVAIELDPHRTPMSTDIDGNHLAIDVDGSLDSVASAPVAFPLADRSPVFVRVAYDGELRAWADDDGPPDGSAPPDVAARIELPTGDLWVGFAAASDSERMTCEVVAFSFLVGDDGTSGLDPTEVDTGIGPDTDPGEEPGPDASGPKDPAAEADAWSDIPPVFFCGPPGLAPGFRRGAPPPGPHALLGGLVVVVALRRRRSP